jgi:hypothetical protein
MTHTEKDASVCKERRRVSFCVCVSPIHMNTCEYMLRPRSAQVMVTVRVTATVTDTVIVMVCVSELLGSR